MAEVAEHVVRVDRDVVFVADRHGQLRLAVGEEPAERGVISSAVPLTRSNVDVKAGTPIRGSLPTARVYPSGRCGLFVDGGVDTAGVRQILPVGFVNRLEVAAFHIEEFVEVVVIPAGVG
jgi:hypothetical protein